VSKRKNEAFYAVNCAAIPRDLMESELFGHVRGAFTGATTHRDGAASMADGGTLFLDEVCEMDLELQKKMLRFIQTGEYQRVGSNKVERADIRFVCATNKDPLVEVREGRFREDLFYRLHVVPIHLPPLRERGEDIIDIAEYFLNYYAARDGKSFTMISDSARSKMLTHQWPGNVRELQNAIQKAVVLNEGNYLRGHMLQLEQLPVMQNRLVHKTDTQQSSAGVTVPFSPRIEVEPLWIVERNTIERAIEICSGNVNKAASLLEVAPSTIYRKLQAWEAKDNRNTGHSCTA
jgi:two-component system repressor protein LuxO